ncbi:MAG: hypothetical protein AMJ72_03875 [Acidithiobacillales bacterium SM1_46]|jgi:ABC-type phosphate transport system substrate-binding protein|nr:MAG: hypothetical protein AMJ72_03875 [Acidithiobacillales bacterium SM1_46]
MRLIVTLMSRHAVFLCVFLAASVSAHGADSITLASLKEESRGVTTVTGAGEHFTWVLLDQIRSGLERDHGIKLDLIGRESMLGHGCTQGIKMARQNRPGRETFGFICCPLDKAEVDKEQLTVHPIAREPLVILVNKANPVSDIPVEKVRAIFRGEIRNWKEVGGPDQPIVIVLRPHCAQRPGHWKTIVSSVDQFRKDRIDVKSEAEVVQGVSDFPEGMGNIGSTWNFDEKYKVKVVTLGGIAPTAANLANGSYPFYQEQSIVTHGPVSPALAGMIRDLQHGAAFREVAKKYELLPLAGTP